MARTIVIQRGHVPRTSGITGTGGIDGNPTEQIFASAAAVACRKRLDRIPGFDVKVIDADVPDASYRGDVFVGIHCDGNDNRSAHGASIGWQSPEGKAFGDLWKRAYAEVGWTRAWRQDNNTPALGGYYGVRKAIERGNRAAICCECGFLTNRDDKALLSLPQGPDRFALAVDLAVRRYFGISTEDIGEDVVAGPRYLIVRGKERNDQWVTDFAVAYPLGGRPEASQADRSAHRDLVVFMGAALADTDGQSFPLEQQQLDSIPKVFTPIG